MIYTIQLSSIINLMKADFVAPLHSWAFQPFQLERKKMFLFQNSTSLERVSLNSYFAFEYDNATEQNQKLRENWNLQVFSEDTKRVKAE